MLLTLLRMQLIAGGAVRLALVAELVKEREESVKFGEVLSFHEFNDGFLKAFVCI